MTSEWLRDDLTMTSSWRHKYVSNLPVRGLAFRKWLIESGLIWGNVRRSGFRATLLFCGTGPGPTMVLPPTIRNVFGSTYAKLLKIWKIFILNESRTCSNEIAKPSSPFGFFVPESDCDLALGFWYPAEYPPFNFESCDLDPFTWSFGVTWCKSGEWFEAVNFCLRGGDSETAFRWRRREGEKTDSSPSGEAVDGSDLHFVKQKTRPGDRPRGTDTTKIENTTQ